MKKFKKIFSTDEVIASTREELNRMIEDMNRNSARDLTLLDNKIKEAKKVIAEAERRLIALNNDFSKQEKNSDFMQILNSNQIEKEVSDNFVQKQEVVVNQNNPSSFSSVPTNPVDAYARNVNVNSEVVAKESNVKESNNSKLPNISFSENPIKPKKSFAQNVCELYKQGLDVEFIARELNSSTTEVQLIIDMNF